MSTRSSLRRTSARRATRMNPASGSGELLVLTIGHSTRPIDEFTALLRAHGVTKVVDVRTVPRSRHNPQFGQDQLPASLRAASIGYEHQAVLGGLRRTSAQSPNQGWRNLSFRGYADHMQTREFQDAVERLIKQTKNGERLALMCAEAVPWRCHRSLIADALLVRGVKCEDIRTLTQRMPHRLTRFAEVHGTKITYPHDDRSPVNAPPSTSRRGAKVADGATRTRAPARSTQKKRGELPTRSTMGNASRVASKPPTVKRAKPPRR